MATRVFLLSGDEKAVHAITQVLDEQDIRFEHSNDSAFTLKRLAAQHFDLLVVDCDNAENATQVFNSARASQLNKTAIAIAIVEGKAGVPNAFRLGASLVLTKPVSLEQVRNTLRTGIGMARKDGSEVKPVVPPPVVHPVSASAAMPAVAQPPVVPPPAAPPAPVVPAPGTFAVTPVAPELPAAPKPIPVAPAATLKLEPETPVEKPPVVPAASLPPAPKPVELPVIQPVVAEAMPVPAPPIEGKSSSKVVDFTIASRATSTAAAPAPAFTSLDLLSDLKEPTSTLPAEVAALGDSVAPNETADAVENPVEETAASLRASAVPSFGGLAKEPFAGIAPAKRNWTGVIAVGFIAAIACGFAGAWSYAPGFKDRAYGAYSEARGRFVHAPQKPAVAAAPRTQAPPAVLPPASAAAEASTAMQPASSAELPAGTGLLASTSTPPAEVGKPTSAPAASASAPNSATQNPSIKPAAATAPTTTPAPAVAKSNAEAPTAPALVNTSATTLPAASVPKAAPSDLFEVPEDYADDQVIHRVHPMYPRQARTKKVQGTVVLQAIVDKQGKVNSLQLVSGDPLLAQAAADAVKQWRYKPYSHNGEPSDFQTRVTVDFKLP